MIECPDPEPAPNGVVIRVEATGICLSDWHAWMGHENLPGLPHVPGHEMAGTIHAVGDEVSRWRMGDRVTVPFSTGCGGCGSCRAGHLNTCSRAGTPGFTSWGSFAEYVAINHADVNVVRIPDAMEYGHAAALGCRFITAFRAIVDQGRLREGQWVSVYGCGGVGLSAVMIASALGGRVIAVDIDEGSLALASELGAEETVLSNTDDTAAKVRQISGGGSHLSMDAVGRIVTAISSIRSLRKHGRHVQVGLMLGPDATPAIPMEEVIMRELEIVGSRGMPATDYPRVFQLIESGLVDPARLVTSTVSLEEASSVLERMGAFADVGVTVIDRI